MIIRAQITKKTEAEFKNILSKIKESNVLLDYKADALIHEIRKTAKEITALEDKKRALKNDLEQIRIKHLKGICSYLRMVSIIDDSYIRG